MKKHVFAILLLSLLLAGCSDKQLARVAKSMTIVATTVGQVQTDVILWEQAGLINTDAAREILQVCTKINAAGLQIDATLRVIEKLDPQSASALIDLLTPIRLSLDPAKLAFIAGIENPETRQKLEAYFILLRTTISTVQIVLASAS